MADIPAIIMLIAMYIAAAIAWPSVPDRLSVHWGLSGKVNRYDTRLEGLRLVPLMATIGFLVARMSSGELASMAVVRLAVAISRAAVFSAMLVYRGRRVEMAKFALSIVGALVVALILALRIRIRSHAGGYS